MVALKHIPPPIEICPAFAGSRNAVVALKPGSVDVHPIGDLRKQERRGGIETISRRACRRARFLEAGTPWWH